MNVGILYLTPEWVSFERQYQLLSDAEPASTAREIKRALEKHGYTAELVSLNPISFLSLKKYDWIFNLTENVFGFRLNESEIALELEALGIPFTGAGSKGLTLCGNKPQAKRIFSLLGILTPDYEIHPLGTMNPSHLHFPLIVKPSLQDASVGIRADSIVENQQEMIRKVKEVHLEFGEPALVEEFIDGRDIEISILGNGDHLRVLPPYECAYLDTFSGPHILSFEAKWDPSSPLYQNTIGICPADLDDVVWAYAVRVCHAIFQAFACRDYARVDFRLREQKLYALDVNPNPCISEVDASFTMSAIAAGFNYPDMVSEILNQSFLSSIKSK